MDMNWLVIIGVTVSAMIAAMVWFGPLFGKLWMKIHGWENLSKDELKAQEEGMGKLLAIEAISTFIMISVIAYFLQNISGTSPYIIAALIWGGFLVPNHISGALWGADKKEYRLHKILVQSGFSLLIVLLAIFLLTTFS